MPTVCPRLNTNSSSPRNIFLTPWSSPTLFANEYALHSEASKDYLSLDVVLNALMLSYVVTFAF